MASIIKDKNRDGQYNGCRTLQFVDANRSRKSVRLGKITAKGADTIKAKVEAILEAAYAGHSWDRETADWVGRMATTNAKLYDKFAAVGLLPPRAGEQKPERVTLGPFLKSYIAVQSKAVKASTRLVYTQTESDLLSYFGSDVPIADITAGDADEFRAWLTLSKDETLHDRNGRGLADNTARRRCGIARQFLHAAKRKRLITENPFSDMREGVTVRPNRSRDYFVSHEEAAKVLAACPDNESRLVFALARYGGLRCPSEHLALTWGDVNWEQQRITVRSPKTAHHDGGDSRVMPMFPELQPYLEAARADLLEDFDPKVNRLSEQPVIRKNRDRTLNLRTQLMRIIQKAGLVPWPKLFQNLRASRATELVQVHPTHVVNEWLGHSEIIAAKHYRQTTDADFARALQKCSMQASAIDCNGPQDENAEIAEIPENAENSVVLASSGLSLPDYSSSHSAQGKAADSQSGQSRAASVLGQPPSRDPDLLLIIARWDSLTGDQKRRIVEVVGEALPAKQDIE